MLEPMKVPQCDARVLVRDDRFGAIEHQCEGLPDHDPPHAIAMTACEPPAELVWWDDGARG